MKKKPKVGQIVYDSPRGYRANRMGKTQRLNEFVVKKVGRKYFYAGEVDCSDHMDHKYFIDTWIEASAISASSFLFQSKQEYEDEMSRIWMASKISKYFKYGQPGKVTVEDLRSVWEILDKYDNGA